MNGSHTMNPDGTYNNDPNIQDGDGMPTPTLGDRSANLDRSEMFAEKIEVFRAGTFKFSKNPNFYEDISKFEKEVADEFYEEHKNQFRNKDNFMLKNYIERMKMEKKPHLKYIKTFVPVFPWLYNTLDNGFSLGPRKNMCLYGTQMIMNPVTKKEEKVHKIAQIKFSIHQNCLLKYEETRTK